MENSKLLKSQKCGACEIEYPMSHFYKNSGVKLRYFKICKHCISAKRHLPKKPKRIIDLPDGKRICRKCLIGKELQEFRKLPKTSKNRKTICMSCEAFEEYFRDCRKHNRTPRKTTDGKWFCNDCENYLPLASFALLSPKNQSTRPRYVNCEKCREFKELQRQQRLVEARLLNPSKHYIDLPDGKRMCPKCLLPKILELDFGNSSQNPKGKSGVCKECMSLARKKLSTNSWQRKLRVFGLTIQDYNELLGKQNNKCKICGISPNGIRLCVDHHHKTGKVRGLLCGKCNSGIGLLQDDFQIIQKAAEYVRDN